MKTVKVRNITFNEGAPKICVPLVGRTAEQIIGEIDFLKNADFDLAELRIDFFEHVDNIEKVTELLKNIRKEFKKPLIFTFRTEKEGGAHYISEEQYFALNAAAVESGMIEIVDIELFSFESSIKKLISLANKRNVKVMMSNHDFFKTPPKGEITQRLEMMQKFGADITKIAVMPNSEEDVLTLLEASLEMKNSKGDRPFITISMGRLGTISRLSGELFGSCMTFAASKESSAPGQVGVKDARNILNILHF